MPWGLVRVQEAKAGKVYALCKYCTSGNVVRPIPAPSSTGVGVCYMMGVPIGVDLNDTIM